MAKNGLNLREGPNLDSKIIRHLPYGSIVSGDPLFYNEDPRNKLDTIDGVPSFWAIVHFKEDIGYAFTAYLYRLDWKFEIDTNITFKTVKINQEGYHLGDIDYHPDLIWYGLYLDSIGFYIKKVNIELVLSKVDGVEKFKDYECFENEGILLETNVNEKSFFLIGVSREWKEGRIYHGLFNPKIGFYEDEGFLYPEREFKFNYKKTFYRFRAYDSIIIDNECNIVKEYQLVVDTIDYPAGIETFKRTFLNNDLKLYGSGNLHSQYLTPQVYWAGDINQDGLLDFIIYQHSMVNHGGVTWTYSLFLSDPNSNDTIFKLADKTATGSCY